MTTPAVEFRSVDKDYGSYRALRNFDLAVPPQSFFCLLGSSGSGKSTALRLIAGLEQLTSGQVLIGGENMSSTPPHRRPVNTVFQSYGLFPHMSLFDNVAYGLRSRRVSKPEVQRRVTDALAMVRMSDQQRKKPRQLSGGQQQRGALARALVNEPSVLLLDEPLGALDLQLRRDMQQELVQLHARTQTTFIHVTHDQEEAFACATDIAVINDGQLLQVGSPTELYRRPKNQFVANFVGTTNLVPVTVVGRERDLYVVRGPMGPTRAGSWTSRKDGETATLVVRPEDIDVADYTHEVPAGWIPGVVSSRVSTGATVRLTVSVNETQLVVETLSSPSTGVSARPGEPVLVRVSREDGWLVEAPDSTARRHEPNPEAPATPRQPVAERRSLPA